MGAYFAVVKEMGGAGSDDGRLFAHRGWERDPASSVPSRRIAHFRRCAADAGPHTHRNDALSARRDPAAFSLDEAGMRSRIEEPGGRSAATR